MLRLHDIMTRDLVTLSPDLTIRDAIDVLTTHHITGAPVVAGGDVVGVVSLTDLAEFAAAPSDVPDVPDDAEEFPDGVDPDVLLDESEPSNEYFAKLWDEATSEVTQVIAPPHGPPWNALETHSVAEVMSRAIAALPPDTPIDRAAAFMRESRIHRVLVMDGRRLLGVVTTTDLANTVADNHGPARVYVFGPPAGLR